MPNGFVHDLDDRSERAAQPLPKIVGDLCGPRMPLGMRCRVSVTCTDFEPPCSVDSVIASVSGGHGYERPLMVELPPFRGEGGKVLNRRDLSVHPGLGEGRLATEGV
jgi:hypothetical protein